MKRVFRIAQRVLLLLFIWGLACLLSVRAVAQAVEHRRLVRETAQLDRQYQQQLKDYARLLAEGERLANDHDYQIELLKKHFGYTAPDETPIVIMHGEDEAAAAGLGR